MARVLPMMKPGKPEDVEGAETAAKETPENEAAENIALTIPADQAAQITELEGAKEGDEFDLTATATIKKINPDGSMDIELADAEFGNAPGMEKAFGEEEPAK